MGGAVRYMPQYMSNVEENLGTQFSSVIWVPESKLRSSGSGGIFAYLLSHLAIPQSLLKNIFNFLCGYYSSLILLLWKHQNQLRRGEGLFDLHFQITVDGRQGRCSTGSLKAGHPAIYSMQHCLRSGNSLRVKETQQKPWWCSSLICPMLMFSQISYTAQDQLPREHCCPSCPQWTRAFLIN